MPPVPGRPAAWARCSRLAKRAALSGVVVAATLLASEGLLRARLAWSGKPFDFREAAASFRHGKEAGRAFDARVGTKRIARADGDSVPILHPYMASEDRFDLGGVFEHFRAGRAPGEFTVVVEGGSVAASFAQREGKVLESALEKLPRLAGRKVTVLNFAHAGHKQPQTLMRTAWLLSCGYRPDLVLNLDGFNEVALAGENTSGGVHPLYPSFPAWGSLVSDYGGLDPRALDLTLSLWKLAQESDRWADFTLKWKLYHSCLWSRLAMRRIAGLQRRRVELQNELAASAAELANGPAMRRQLGGPDFPESQEGILDLCVRGWAESSRSLRALCESRGILYVHVLQPALGDKGSKPLTEKEKAIVPPSKWWMMGPELGYPKLREAGKVLATAGEKFVDASGAFAAVEESVYIDPCHLEPEGDRILEKTVEKGLIEAMGER